MGDLLTRLRSLRKCLAGVLLMVGLCMAAPCSTVADQTVDPATQQAIDTTFDIAKPGLAAAGVTINDEEENLVKSVMGCALQGSKLEDCGRQVLVGQLNQLPPPAAALTDCLLQGKKVDVCGEQAVVSQLNLPPELSGAATCLANAATSGGNGAADCVRQGVVDAISKQDASVGQIANCLLQQKPVAQCATGPLMNQINANLGPDAGAAATCLIQKQDPTQCTAELAKAGGIDKLPPEVTCISNKTQAAIQACLQQKVISDLPGDASQKALAQCMLDPAKAQKCATDQIAAQLPPGTADAAQCIATAANPATCASKVAKGAGLGDALDTLNKVMSNTQLVDPGKAPSSLANLLKVADGIRHDNWGEVIEYGGAELYKAAAKIILADVIPIPGLSILAGPIVDTMVQDRIDLVNQLLTEAKKCSKLDPSQCDTAKMGEILGEFYMLMQIEVPCSLLSQFPPKVREVTCGPLGAAIVAVGSTAYDIYKDNDKELAGVAAVLFPGSGIAEAIVALDPDFENAVIGKNSECPANYFSSHVAVCFKDAAYLSMVDPAAEAALIKSVNDACHQDFLPCSQRNAAGKALDCAGNVVGTAVSDIGGLFSGDAPKAPTCHVDDSDRVAKQCDPLKSALSQAADDLRNRTQALANEYAASDPIPTPKDQCAPLDNLIAGFVSRCAAALPSKLPGIDGGNFSACNTAGRNLPPNDLFGAACKAAAMDKLRAQRTSILSAKGVATNQSPAAQDAAFNKICGDCEIYGSRAIQFVNQAASAQCGETGPRWSTNFQDHKQWCLTAPAGAVAAEDQARQAELQTCLSCQDYADHALKSARTNVTYKCGGVGPRYTLDPAAHIQFCRTAQPFQMQQENDARHVFLDQCLKNFEAANTPPAPPAANCVQVTVVNPANCADPNQRRGADGVCFACSPDAHFDSSGRCALCSPGFHAINGDVCVSDRAQPEKPACPPASSGTPVVVLPVPLVSCPGDLKLVGTQCSCPPGSTRTADNRCTTAQATTPVPPLPQPPGQQHPFPQPVGGTAVCAVGFHMLNNVCVADKAPPTGTGGTNGTSPNGSNPGACKDPNQRRGADGVCFSCSHNDHFDASNHCVPCAAGFHVLGNACVPDKTTAPTGTGGTNGTLPGGSNAPPTNQGACKDPNQRRGADGVCFSCSHNDHFDASNHCVPCAAGFHVQGDACVPDKSTGTGGTNGTLPNGSNQGACKDPNQRRGADGVCFSCSHNDHFDASNHCVPCAAGFHVLGNACVPDKTTTPSGGGGTNGTQTPPTTAQPVKCDSPFLGFKPNCQCQLGDRGTPPNCCAPALFKNGVCTKAAPVPTTCPANRPVGTPPNCCPPGRIAKGGICVSNCPAGYTVLDKPNKYGAYCEAPVTTTKPPVTTTTPVGPAPKHCTTVTVCDAFGKGAPGTLSGPCIKSHTEQDCGPPVQGPK